MTDESNRLDAPVLVIVSCVVFSIILAGACVAMLYLEGGPAFQPWQWNLMRVGFGLGSAVGFVFAWRVFRAWRQPQSEPAGAGEMELAIARNRAGQQRAVSQDDALWVKPWQGILAAIGVLIGGVLIAVYLEGIFGAVVGVVFVMVWWAVIGYASGG